MAYRRFRSGILASLLLAATGTAAPADAMEFRGGLLRQDAFSLWAIGTNRERAWAILAEVGFDPVARVLGGDIAPMVGGTLAPGRELDTAYAGLTWTLEGDAAFLRLGIGGLIHSGNLENRAAAARRRQLGSRVLFHVPVEVGLRLGPDGGAAPSWVGLYFSHMSNADLADPNPGMDNLGVRLGWRF